MKKQVVMMAMLMSNVAFAQSAIGLAPVKHLYIPAGFDSNDSVEVVVTGTFPNPCFARNTVAVNVVNDQIAIEITAIRRDTKSACPAMLVPYKEVVAIGNLQGGAYDIHVNDQLNDKLTIQEATSNSVDDHLYAAIDHIEKIGPNDYVLKGWRYSYCVDLDRVEVVSNGKDTLSILPVMKQTSTLCPMKGMPVSYPVKLDFRALDVKQPLIHVRTMDGKSFNSILNQEEVK
jgi:hypothetical protein